MIKSLLKKKQEPLCSSNGALECAKKIKVERQGCLPPCSGLIVTGLSKFDYNKNIENAFPDFLVYKNYKKVSPYPLGFKGYNFILDFILGQKLTINQFRF